MSSYIANKRAPLAGRTEPEARASLDKAINHRVQIASRKYLDGSLTNQGAKGKKQFLRLSKTDKREWREALQRNINSLKSRMAARVLSGVEPRGKTAYRWKQLTRLEEALIDNIRESTTTEVEYQGFGDMATRVAVSAAAVTVAGAAIKTHQTLRGVDKMVSEAGPSVKTTTDGLSAFVESIQGFLDTIKHLGEFLWKPMLIGLGVWLLTKYAHVSILTAAVCSSVVMYIPEIKSLFERFMPKAIRVQDGGIGLAADLISMICTCWVPGKDAKSVTGEFMKRASNFPRASDGIEQFIKKILALMEEFINFLLNRKESERISLNGKLNAFESWRREAIDRITYVAQNPKMPIEEIRKIKDLQIRGLGFHQVLATMESKRELNFWLEKLALALAPHEGAINAENNMRAMPSCIMIGGNSGVGKTTMIRYVASMVLVLSRECTLSDALDNLWQKGSTEYWNGYIGQKCLVMDDCFQVKGKPGDMDSEAMQMIRGIGNWSYPLNFADLPSKGKIYLDSPLIVGTTNCKNVHTEWAPFITEPLALTRRFQTACWVSLNPEYATEEGRFDYKRVNAMFHDIIVGLSDKAAQLKAEGKTMSVDEVLDVMPWDIWRLHPHTFDRSDITESVMPGGLRSVVENTAKEIRMRKSANREEIKDISALLSVLTDALEVEPQAGIKRYKGFKSEPITSVRESVDVEMFRSFDVPSAGVEDEYPDIPPCILAESSDFVFLNKKGTNLERAQAWYAALAAEKEHHWLIESILTVFSRWKFIVEETAGGWGLLTVMFEGMMISVWITLIFKIAKALIVGAVNVFMAVVGHVLSLFGVKAKSEPNEKTGSGHMDIPTYNSLGPLNAQVGVSPSEHVYDNIYCNTLKCSTPDADVGQFLGIGADVFIFPKHFIHSFSGIPKHTVLTFTSAKDGAKGTMTIADFLELRIITVPKYDIAAVAFGRGFAKASKQILHYFLAQHEIKQILRGSNTSVRLDVAAFKKNGQLKQNTMFSPTCQYQGRAVAANTNEPLDGLVRYTAPTEAGDCGAPLTLAENRHFGGRCLMGFHSAGRDNIHGREGYSTIISQELAREVFMQLHTYTDGCTDHLHEHGVTELHGKERVEVQDALNAKGLTAGSFELIGTLDEPVNLPTKTALKLSTCGRDEIFGPCPVAPAKLKATKVGDELKEPMIQGLAAYQTDLEYKNPRQLEPIVDLAMQKHWEATQHHPRTILDFNEAVTGPESWKLKPINRKTSPGYKYRHFVSGSKPGKTAFFGADGDYVLDDPKNKALTELKEDVECIIEAAKDKVRYLHLCTDFLKDELRPLAKVESVSTRVISGTPLDYTIAVRMYFGAFLAAMFDTYVSNGMAPGINQYTQWFSLVTALQAIGDKNFDGDFSRFDASEQPWMHEGILVYVNRWYRHNNPLWKEEDDVVRGILWLDLVHSRHVTGCGSALHYVVQWSKSLPSGHPLTTMVNSMYSLISLTGCYVMLTGDAVDMWKHAYICTFGDDNVSSVDDTVCDKFNQVTVAQCMKEAFGLTYTPGDKSGVLVPYTTLDNITFLKRSFKVDDALANRLLKTCAQPLGWVGPLDFASFLYIPYWYKNTRTASDEIITRVEQMLCELSLHPEEAWDKYYPIVAEWCTSNNVPLKYSSREITRTFVAQRMDVWF